MKRNTNYQKLWAEIQREADQKGHGDIVRALGPEDPEQLNPPAHA